MTEDETRKLVREEVGNLLSLALEALNVAGVFDEVLVVPFLEGLLDPA